MKEQERRFYDAVKNWDFGDIKMVEENLTDFDMVKIICQNTTEQSKILDLGTGGGERVIKDYPVVKEILGTDFSSTMIETARRNLEKSQRKDISFREMDNLKMDTPSEYFDIVTVRHTCIDPVQIYRTLKPRGMLVVRGVDKLDCWELKRLFGRGQAYDERKPISQKDYEAILDAGFKEVELVPIHIREYYQTPEDLLALLLKVPILDEFSERRIEPEIFAKYVFEHKTPKGISLFRQYYGIIAKK